MTSAVGTTVSENEIDRLRLVAFQTNSDSDKAAYYLAVSHWFQDRHFRAMAQKSIVSDMLVALKTAEMFVEVLAAETGGTTLVGSVTPAKCLERIRAAIAGAIAA